MVEQRQESTRKIIGQQRENKDQQPKAVLCFHLCVPALTHTHEHTPRNTTWTVHGHSQGLSQKGRFMRKESETLKQIHSHPTPLKANGERKWSLWVGCVEMIAMSYRPMGVKSTPWRLPSRTQPIKKDWPRRREADASSFDIAFLSTWMLK